MQQMPIIGMIVPPAHGRVPPEPLALYGDRARFLAHGLALPELTEDGYDAVIGHVGKLAARLAENGAEVISLMGTSLSFYRGAGFNQQLIGAMQAASGRPATTMTDSIIAALRHVGAHHLAVATAYTDAVNSQLTDYLEGAGFQIAALRAMSLTDVDAIQAVGEDTLLRLGRDAVSAATSADALLISCGGLRTLGVTPRLEAETGLPVISSALAGAWGAARLIGIDPSAPHAGQLFAKGDMLAGQF